MKKALLGLIALCTLVVASPASANTDNEGWVYLGAARNKRHCQQLATAAGYAYYQYGAALVNGVYILNACLAAGSHNPPPPPPPTISTKWFVVTPYHATLAAAESCAQEIEESLPGVRCYTQESYPKFECKARANMKQRLADVGCVRSVTGPHNECVLCGGHD